jgi:hypothetical protein
MAHFWQSDELKKESSKSNYPLQIIGRFWQFKWNDLLWKCPHVEI